MSYLIIKKTLEIPEISDVEIDSYEKTEVVNTFDSYESAKDTVDLIKFELDELRGLRKEYISKFKEFKSYTRFLGGKGNKVIEECDKKADKMISDWFKYISTSHVLCCDKFLAVYDMYNITFSSFDVFYSFLDDCIEKLQCEYFIVKGSYFDFRIS